MKLKSLFLGSVAAAGLSTGAFAADLNVLTSLDVCDLLGMSGLTISSDSNCLAITGEVKYEFNWGDFNGTDAQFGAFAYNNANWAVMDNDQTAAGVNQDWNSKVESWVQFAAASESDFGTAKAVVKFHNEDKNVVKNEVTTAAGANAVGIKEAYVSVGDGTVLIAGRRDTSTFNKDDDVPFNFLGLYHADGDVVDKGVGVLKNHLPTKGHVIQLYHDLGNGVVVKGGLEAINAGAVAATAAAGANPGYAGIAAANAAGTAIGTIEYAGDGVSAHLSVAAGGILDGTVEDWMMHAGVSATMDNFKVLAALAAGSSTVGAVTTSEWNGLVSGQATFDQFTIAISGEAANITQGATSITQFGIGGSVSADVADGITVKLGGRYFDPNNAVANDEGYQAALALVAALSETLTATGEIGFHGTGSAAVTPSSSVTYGSVELAWNPGGDFTSSVKGTIQSNGGYKTTFKAAKKFQ